jgi:carbonic anhydrase
MITLTKEIRKALTPQKAIELLKSGNLRFVNNLKAHRDLLQQMNDTSEGQYPFAFILSCIDSRTSAELIFDQGLGDIFSCRIAGNILNDDIIGSAEFACKIAGAKLIMVLGHTGCGAIQGACDQIKMGNITGLLAKINPALAAAKSITQNCKADNPEFVSNVTALNVRMAMQQITERSAILKEMNDKKEIAIIGGLYDVSTGMVEFY